MSQTNIDTDSILVGITAKVLSKKNLWQISGFTIEATIESLVVNGITTAQELSNCFGITGSIESNDKASARLRTIAQAGVSFVELAEAIEILTNRGIAVEEALNRLQSIVNEIEASSSLSRSTKDKGLFQALTDLYRDVGFNVRNLSTFFCKVETLSVVIWLINNRDCSVMDAFKNV
jgi:hypothetical protein